MTKSKRKPKGKKRAAKKWPRINAAVAAKVLKVVDAGLVSGMGDAVPGQMCVEAAVCYAMGEPHSDKPKCVLEGIRDLKISLNDNYLWAVDGDNQSDETKKLRSKGLRALAIAQLGSKGAITPAQWSAALKEYLFKQKTAEERAKILKAEKKRLKEIADSKKKDRVTIVTALKNLDTGKSYDINVSYDAPEDSFDDGEVDGAEYTSSIIQTIKSQADLKRVSADMVKILTKLGSPGSKFLYLTK